MVACGVARRWHDHPAALGAHEVADEVVREIVTPRLGHGDVVPQIADKQANSAVQSGPGERVEMPVCLGPSSGGADE